MQPVEEKVNVFSTASNNFFSEKDIYVNMKLFPDDRKILFVTGLSGSGKSTLAKKLAEKYKATYIELDLLHFCRKPYTESWLKDHNFTILLQYMNEKGKSPDFMVGMRRNIGNAIDEILQFVQWLETQDGLFVIEGIQVPYIMAKYPKYYTYPIVFKGTSKMKSILRMLLRDRNGKMSMGYVITHPHNVIRQICDILAWYNIDKSQIDAARAMSLFHGNYRTLEEGD